MLITRNKQTKRFHTFDHHCISIKLVSGNQLEDYKNVIV